MTGGSLMWLQHVTGPQAVFTDPPPPISGVF